MDSRDLNIYNLETLPPNIKFQKSNPNTLKEYVEVLQLSKQPRSLNLRSCHKCKERSKSLSRLQSISTYWIKLIGASSTINFT